MKTTSDTNQEELAKKEHEQQLKRLQEEVEVYQYYLSTFLADKTIRGTLALNGVQAHECSIWIDDSEENPGVELVETIKGKNTWFKLVISPEDEALRIWIDKEALAKTFKEKEGDNEKE